MSGSSKLAKHNWGPFGSSIKRQIVTSTKPNFEPRWFSDESLSDGPWNKHRVYAKYYVGNDVLINDVADKFALLAHVFPIDFYNACQNELKQLVTKVPASTNQYAQMAWCIHTSYCVYGMYLAMNGHPGFWRTALSFAQDINYMPPEEGWASSFDLFSRPKVKSTVKSYVTDPFFYLESDEFGYTDGGSIQNWFLGQNMPWAGVFGVGGVTKSELNTAKALDKTKQQGLELLLYRAAFVSQWGVDEGGKRRNLDWIVNIFETNGPAFTQWCCSYWKARAVEILNIPYWNFVRGGTAAWKWFCVLSLCVNKFGVSNEDMKTLYDAHKDQRKLIFKAQLIGLITKLAKVIYKAVEGDLYGAGKAYYDGVKWEKAQNKVADSAIPPYEGAFTFPPCFLRSLKDSKYTFDLFGSNKATVCDAVDRNCESVTGTVPAITNITAHVHRCEQLIGGGVKIWDPPVDVQGLAVDRRKAAANAFAKTAAANMPPMLVKDGSTAVAAFTMPSFKPVLAALAVTGSIATLLWRLRK